MWKEKSAIPQGSYKHPPLRCKPQVGVVDSNDYYNGYTRGKVVTHVESNMPLLAIPDFGGTKCVKDGCPDLYQMYWRIFIRKKEKK